MWIRILKFGYGFHPYVAMEVVGLCGQSRAGYRPERETLRDECRLVIHQRGLLVSPIYFDASVFLLQGVGGALENLYSGLGRNHGEYPGISSRG